MENVASKIPDVWYDLYVRLIPGTFFVSATLFVFGLFPKSDSIAGAVWIIIAGYILGHLMQPISAFVAKLIANFVGEIEERNKVRPAFDPNHREILVLSKQHAETTGMVGCLLFTGLLAIVQNSGIPIVQNDNNAVGIVVVYYFPGLFLATCSLGFLAMAFERAVTAKKRAVQLQKRREYLDYVTYSHRMSDEDAKAALLAQAPTPQNPKDAMER